MGHISVKNDALAASASTANAATSSFTVHLDALCDVEEALRRQVILPRHAVFDIIRTTFDAIISATRCFLSINQHHELVKDSCAASIQFCCERLLDAEILTVNQFNHVEALKSYSQAMASTSGRTITMDDVMSLVHESLEIVTTWAKWMDVALKTRSIDFQLMTCSSLHLHCRASLDVPSIISPPRALKSQLNDKEQLPCRQHHSLPNNWSSEEFSDHCRPLYNTAIIDLGSVESAEQEEYERKCSEREEAIKEWKQADLEYKKEMKKVSKFKKTRELWLKKKQAKEVRAMRLTNGEITEAESEEQEQKEAAEEAALRPVANSVNTEEDEHNLTVILTNDDGITTSEFDAPIISPTPPPPFPEKIPEHVPLAFNCIICHLQIVNSSSLHRIGQNMIFTKPEQKLDNVFTIEGEKWVSQIAEEEISICESISGDPLAGETSSNEDGDAENTKSSGIQSLATYCRGCQMYLGRYYPNAQRFRLIYIHRGSGLNYLYFTGTVNEARLPPLIKEVEEEEAEDSQEVEDVEEQKEQVIATKSTQKQIPPVVGLPTFYSSSAQANIYPFPRFGYLLRYSNVPSSAATKSPPQTTEQDGNTIKIKTVDQNPQIPFLAIPQVIDQLIQEPDSMYPLELHLITPSIRTNLEHLLAIDRNFIERRLLYIVRTHVEHLFTNFPLPVYANPLKSPIPAFLPFFTQPPNFYESRGTSRYVFHFLTGTDDSSMKRYKFSASKLKLSLSKHGAQIGGAVAHVCIGGYGGHRLVIVQVGNNFRIFQSNGNLEHTENRFTLLEWIGNKSTNKWNRGLDSNQFDEFLSYVDMARRGSQHHFESLFCRQAEIQKNIENFDSWQCEDVFFATAKLLPFALRQEIR